MKHKQKQPLYLITSIGNLDNLVDLEDELPQTFEKLEDATNEAKEVTKQYGLKTYVYKCVPVVQIERGKLRITKL